MDKTSTQAGAGAPGAALIANNDRLAFRRKIAIDVAVDLAKQRGGGTAAEVVSEAKIIDAYLAG